MSSDEGLNADKDNVVITLMYENGSVGTVLYTSNGAASHPKENVKVFCNGHSAEIHNFLKMKIYKGSRVSSFTKLEQDKGFGNEYNYLYDIITGKIKEPQLRFEDIVSTTKASISANNG
jgi:hypothetical protein